MRITSVLGIAGSLILGYCNVSFAQSNLRDPWPAPPKFDLKDNYSESEKEVVNRLLPYYDMTEKDFSYLPLSRLWKVPGLRDKALELSEVPAAIKGRIAQAPSLSNAKGETYLILGLLQVNGSPMEKPLVFYRKENTVNCLRSPQFAPDGKSAVIRLGLPQDELFSGFDLFLWDFASARMRYLPMPSVEDGKKPLLGVNEYQFLDHLEWSPGSRYLSYMRGGSSVGYSGTEYQQPFYLCVLDTVSRRERLVMKDAGLSWSWTYHGQILSSLSPIGEAELHTKRPSVYTTDAQSGAAKKLFDGGYYAEESPDGRWIAFCDWPGELSDAPDAPAELKSSTKRGLFLWDKTSKTRSFIGEMALLPNQEPVLQWSPDGKCLYATEKVVNPDGNSDITYNIYKVTLVTRKLEKLTSVRYESKGNPYLNTRGISPDGKRLYFEWRVGIPGPDLYNNQLFTLFAIDTEKGMETRIARLTDMVNEHPDWDWHDDSGINPAFAAAQKIEGALPQIKAPSDKAN